MARIPDLDLETFTAEQKRVYQTIASGPRGSVPGPLAIWMNRPELADKAQQLGRYCRYDSSLPTRLSELAILTTARIWDATFEWQAHEPFAREAGLAESTIKSLSLDEEPLFAEADESVVYRFSRELNLQRKVSDELYREATEILGQDSLIDLVAVLGYYALISMTINAFEIDPM